MSGDSFPPTAADHDGDARRRWVENRTTFQRVYDVVTGTTAYASAGDLAERADCSDDGARAALSQLVEMGVAEKRGGRPAEYRRNESYFRWKRTEELAAEHATEELRSRLDDLLAEDESLQDRFGVPSPDAVTPAFDGTDHDEIHDRGAAIRRWRTVRRDIELLQQAIHRTERSEGDTSDSAPA